MWMERKLQISQKFSFSSRTRKQISTFLFSLLETRFHISLSLLDLTFWHLVNACKGLQLFEYYIRIMSSPLFFLLHLWPVSTEKAWPSNWSTKCHMFLLLFFTIVDDHDHKPFSFSSFDYWNIDFATWHFAQIANASVHNKTLILFSLKGIFLTISKSYIIDALV